MTARPEPRHLVMLSGGPESAWNLKHVLATTDEPVLALHVVLVDSFGRHEQETFACKRIMEYCRRHLRTPDDQPDYQTAKLVHPPTSHYWDMHVLAPFAGMVAKSAKRLGHVWAGTYAGDDSGRRDQEFAAIARIVAERADMVFHFEPHAHDKARVRAELGEDLWDLTWSCRTPQQGKPCNRCQSCVNRSKADG